MKTVTICGSLRFAEEMKNIAFELEAVKGCHVLQCVYNNQNMEITAEMAENLRLAHLKKIDLSDIIYVLNIDGYIGNSVEQEIAYAQKCHKQIIYYNGNN